MRSRFHPDRLLTMLERLMREQQGERIDVGRNTLRACAYACRQLIGQ